VQLFPFLEINYFICRTVVGFLDAELTGTTLVLAILKFIYIFVGSIIVAVIIALLSAIVSFLYNSYIYS
jgi:uncharacterized metal-binding protein